MSCNVECTPIDDNPFLGCDGKPVSTDTLHSWLMLALRDENYLWAAELRDEISRRTQKALC